MNKMPDAQLCHIGLYAFDLETMVDFYSRVFGLVVTDRGHSKRGFDIAFLSRDPIEHHQIAIASGRPKEAVHTTINQISFRVPGLEELRQYYPWLVQDRVKSSTRAIMAMPGASISPIRRAIAWSSIARRPGTSASRSVSRST